MINEVEAITDGRSLHRRLAVEGAGDELGRLAVTLNEMMERLEKSFAALRRFTADASHELKTPLTVLRADVERAMSPTTARGDRLVALEEALAETRRMSDLVDSLLTLARARTRVDSTSIASRSPSSRSCARCSRRPSSSARMRGSPSPCPRSSR